MKQMLVTIALSQEQRTQLVQAAPEYSVVWSPPGEVTEETVASSEVIFGTVPPDYLAKAGKLGLLQLDSAGADRFVRAGTVPETTPFCRERLSPL